MYISYNWLRELVNIPKSVTPEKLEEELTLKTAEVEEVKPTSEGLENVVAGKIVSIKKHPDADKLNIAQIDCGIRGKKQILFGNVLQVSEGDVVPVALPGAVLPNGLEIAEREMRGEMSQGMISVDEELGFESSSKNSYIRFSDDTKLGTEIADLLGLRDFSLEIDNKSLTHRPDLWGHVGIAREVAAIYGKKLKDPSDGIGKKATKTTILGKKIEPSDSKPLTAKIEAKDVCSRYMALRIEGIKIAESSQEIKSRLLAIGIRPINNVVDATNYVMYELGQPLHAFDAQQVANQNIVVRKARKGEMLETIDHTKRKLESQDLVIADKKEVVALAGIMGGVKSEVNKKTKDVILEAATFDSTTIRKTAQRLALHSDASQRFEKTLDPVLAESAILRTAELILKDNPDARVTSQLVDAKNYTDKTLTLSFDLDFLNARAGFDIPRAKAVSILKSLGFSVKGAAKKLAVGVPSYRATKDISIPEDLVEEVSRIYGYENFPIEMPEIKMISREVNECRVRERELKAVMKGLGWNEVQNYSFVQAKDAVRAGMKKEAHISLANPASEGHELMRTSLLPGLLTNARRNARVYDSFQIFEIDRIFRKEDGEFDSDIQGKRKLPEQHYEFAGMLYSKTSKQAFWQLKGQIESAMKATGYTMIIDSAQADVPWADESSMAKIIIEGQTVGIMARVKEQILGNFKVKGNAAAFIIHYDRLASIAQPVPIFEPMAKYPSSERDVAVICDMSHTAREYIQAIQSIDPLIKQVDLFDVYRGSQIPQGKRSLAFRISYQSPKRTLKDDEIDLLQQRVESQLKKKFDADVRKQ
ncbi:phenylalanine--tRNA ligase subunit beta [Patescibacteria group bacterium]